MLPASILLSITPAAAAAATFAASAAIVWGAGDFAGGLATRRNGALQVVAIAHGFDVVLLSAIVLAMHLAAPATGPLLWGLAGGIVNGFALTTFYLALSSGEMGLAAALCGVLTAAVPVLIDWRIEGAPHPRQLAGFAVAAAAIFLISRSDAPPHRRALLLAALAGIGFGIFLVLARQSAAGGLLWPTLISRAGSASVAVLGLLLLRGQRNSPGAPAEWKKIGRIGLSLAIGAGLLDAAGNLFYLQSTRLGRMDIAAVLASLYPVATILLAIIVLRERATRTQAIGMALAIAAVALIVR